MTGRFITFEGIDGSGKSTQLRLLEGRLRFQGYDVITTLEPGGTPLGRRLREAFLETEEVVAPISELLLFAADRAQHVNFLIKPSIAAGRIVISDRYADATVAYQGAGRGFDKKTIDDVIALATEGLKPDITLYFDVSIETAIARADARSDDEAKKNRMDGETAEFYSRVRESYLDIARHEPARVKVIDANGSVEDIQSQVFSVIDAFLADFPPQS